MARPKSKFRFFYLIWQLLVLIIIIIISAVSIRRNRCYEFIQIFSCSIILYGSEDAEYDLNIK